MVENGESVGEEELKQKLIVQEILEVLYSPVKAFEEIVKKPSVKGPLLILALTLVVTAILQGVTASKILFLAETPENDDWTESASLWSSNGVTKVDDTDSVVGNYSVKSFVANSTFIWMNITDIGQFNCLEETGYKTLSFQIKWIHQNETFPSSNATLRLFSSDKNGYFELDLINLINSSNTWANVTVDVGSENPNWTSSPNSPDWGNITGLEFKLAWSTSDAANLTLKIDDLHFGKYVSLFAVAAFDIIFYFSVDAFIAFFLNWAIYGILLLMFTMMLGGKAGSLTRFFIIIGHVFIITTLYLLINTLLFSTLPQITAETFQEKWLSNWAFQLGYHLDFTFKAWMAVLFAIAIHSLSKVTWIKAAVISAIASILGFFFTLAVL